MKHAIILGAGLSVLFATPAVARPIDLDLQSEAGVSWSHDRTPAVSRSALHPVGTTRSPARAVAYLLSLAQAHTTGYWGRCLTLADDAYMPRGPRLQTAFDQWYRAKDAGVAHPKDEDPPLGAQMFWDPGHYAGHIATYVGDGKAVTNMPDGSVRAIDWHRMNDWGPYLGWADPYYK